MSRKVDKVATKYATIEALEKSLKMQDMPTADGAISAEFGRLYDNITATYQSDTCESGYASRTLKENHIGNYSENMAVIIV